MADETWTVVGRRRAARIRRSGAAVMPPLQAEECDTALLRLSLKRSIARVQESVFFQRFLLQVQSAPVCDLLFRAASTSCSRSLQDDDALEHERGLLRDELPDGFAERFSHERALGNQDVSLPMRSLTAGAGASFSSASRVQVCERVQNVPEAGASNASTNTLIGTNAIAMVCKCSDAVCTCGTFALQENTERWHLNVILYGLGSIADSEVSRCQLALILLLKERFSWVGIIEVYDPVLTHSECEVIKDMGCLPVALDEKGRRSVTGPTLFYMPHCEDWLYDNVLQANWASRTLRQIVILGNSFQDYQERYSSPVGRKSIGLSYVSQYQQIAKEVPLEATFSSDLRGFNNISWHFYALCDTL